MSAIALTFLTLMSPFIVIGIYSTWKFFLPRFLGYTAVLNPKKDGSYTLKWVKIGNKKSIKVEGQERIVDPKGKFTGPLGNMFIYIGESARPVTSEDTSANSEIDVEDVGTIASLSYFAGRLAGAKKMELLERLFYVMVGILAINVVLLALYWQDRTQVLQMLRETLARVKTLAP